jgi:hypothetical protein
VNDINLIIDLGGSGPKAYFVICGAEDLPRTCGMRELEQIHYASIECGPQKLTRIFLRTKYIALVKETFDA